MLQEMLLNSQKDTRVKHICIKIFLQGFRYFPPNEASHQCWKENNLLIDLSWSFPSFPRTKIFHTQCQIKTNLGSETEILAKNIGHSEFFAPIWPVVWKWVRILEKYKAIWHIMKANNAGLQNNKQRYFRLLSPPGVNVQYLRPERRRKAKRCKTRELDSSYWAYERTSELDTRQDSWSLTTTV